MKTQQYLTTAVTMMTRATWGRGFRWAFAGLVAAWIVSTAAARPAAAQVFEGEPILVDDDGDEVGTSGLTLREAIALAQATPDNDRIVFADHVSVIQLTQGELLLGDLIVPPNSGWLLIDGGEEGVVLDAGGGSGVMEIESGSVILTGLAFTNGYGGIGGGLMIWDLANVTLANSLVADNYATSAGGGIFNAGLLTMTDTVVADNYSRDSGGGVLVYGAFGGRLSAVNSSFSGNEARSSGGGIYNTGGDVSLFDSTVSYNTARNGGGIYNLGGSLSVSSTSFIGNQAAGKGGDIYFTSGSFDPTGLDGLDIYGEGNKSKGGGRR